MKFPNSDIKNIKLFYLITFLSSAIFMAGNWIFFWTMFMTYEQLGWIDAVAFGFGVFIEIPTGAIADLIGKKKTVIIAFGLTAFGIIMMSIGISWLNILLGFLICQLGWALYSGSGEALAYDTLVDEGREDSFDEVISVSSSISTVTGAVAALIGIPLFALSPGLPHFAWGAFYLFAFLVSFALKEPKSDTEKFTLKGYIEQLGRGFRQVFSKKLWMYSIFFLLITGIVFMYNWGLIRPAIAAANDLFDKEQSVIYTVASLLSSGVALLVPAIRKRISDFIGLTVLGMLTSITVWSLGMGLGIWTIAPMLVIAVIGGLSSPWISTVVNKETPSKDRATTISTMALFSRLPYLLVAVVAGKMIDDGRITEFTNAMFIVILVGILVNMVGYFLFFRKKS